MYIYICVHETYNNLKLGYIYVSNQFALIHYCCTASTETTSTVPGAVTILPITSASGNQSEILNRSKEPTK